MHISSYLVAAAGLLASTSASAIERRGFFKNVGYDMTQRLGLQKNPPIDKPAPDAFGQAIIIGCGLMNQTSEFAKLWLIEGHNGRGTMVSKASQLRNINMYFQDSEGTWLLQSVGNSLGEWQQPRRVPTDTTTKAYFDPYHFYQSIDDIAKALGSGKKLRNVTITRNTNAVLAAPTTLDLYYVIATSSARIWVNALTGKRGKTVKDTSGKEAEAAQINQRIAQFASTTSSGSSAPTPIGGVGQGSSQNANAGQGPIQPVQYEQGSSQNANNGQGSSQGADGVRVSFGQNPSQGNNYGQGSPNSKYGQGSSRNANVNQGSSNSNYGQGSAQNIFGSGSPNQGSSRDAQYAQAQGSSQNTYAQGSPNGQGSSRDQSNQYGEIETIPDSTDNPVTPVQDQPAAAQTSARKKKTFLGMSRPKWMSSSKNNPSSANNNGPSQGGNSGTGN